jgi:hypothetical protein
MSWKERRERPIFCIPLSGHENTEDEEGKRGRLFGRKVMV